MARSLIIIFLLVLTSTIYGLAWGKSDVERCRKAYETKDYVTAYPACLNAAKQGDADAQFNLGVMYEEGNGDKRVFDYSEAAKWYRKAAEQGNAKAQFKLGRMIYINEIAEGVKHDSTEASTVWYRKAAEQGYDLAQYELARAYEHGSGVKQDYAEALKWYQKAAEQGDSDAQFRLGMLYYEGQGVKQDYVKAADWSREAADQGNAYAQILLGGMYYYGQGVKQDYKEAVSWYRKAAEQGNAEAQYKLGLMYYDGRGVKLPPPRNQDYAEAAAWYRKAAEQGYAAAQYNLGRLYDEGQGVERDYTEAAAWHRKAAEQGIAEAQAQLGSIYFLGRGVKQDFTEAKLWSRKAAEQGNAFGQFLLGMLLKQNYAESAAWYHKAAEQGLPAAQYYLGLLYYKGNGVKQDSNEAAAWFRRAAEQGNVNAKSALDLFKGSDEAAAWFRKEAEQGDSFAQYELAKRYISGEGIEKNKHLAEKWLIHAIHKDEKNQKYIELMEKEFDWHCIFTQNNRCSDFINNKSITHDKNLSWYWSQFTNKLPDKNDKDIFVFKTYNVMNCNNKTVGNKAYKFIDYNYDVIPNTDQTITDSEIEFQPLEPGDYSDKLFDYVCTTNVTDKKSGDVQEVVFGTGWTVKPGYIVTNQHVVNGKKKIAVMSTAGEKISAMILVEDKINDLALLQVNQPGKLPPALPVAKLSAKTGSKVFTIGYPHPDIMGAKPKLTEGIVNAVTGYKDDPRTLQISVPVQGGNSGGPLLNMNGEVVGIVTSKLSAVKMFNWTGDLPQNVNYAVKTPYLSALLSSVDEQASRIKALPAKPASLESLSSRIQNSILMIIAE